MPIFKGCYATLYSRQLCNIIAYDNVDNIEYYRTLHWRISSLEISKIRVKETYDELLFRFFGASFLMGKNDAS